MALNLPDSRNTNYAPGTPVRSEDLDDIQDKIIDIATGDRYRKTDITGLVTGGAGPSLAGNGSVDFPSVSFMLVHVDAPEKSRLTAIRGTALHSGAAGSFTIELHQRPTGGPSALVGTMSWANEAEVAKELDVVAAVPPDGLLVDKDTAYYLEITNGAGDPAVLYTVSYKADRLNYQ